MDSNLRSKLSEIISRDRIDKHFLDAESASDTGCVRIACRKLWKTLNPEEGFPFSFQKSLYDEFPNGGVLFSQNNQLFEILESTFGVKVSRVFQRQDTPLLLKGNYSTNQVPEADIDYKRQRNSESEVAGMLFLVRNNLSAGHTIMFVADGEGLDGYSELSEYLQGREDEWHTEAMVFFERK